MNMDTRFATNNPPYQMSISLSVLNHLGIGLYSNVPAVLSEIVANAWDADAENVHIDIDSEQGLIVISDDGCGMTQADINKKYLNVGYQKRENEPNRGITPQFNREPMGRKGIGKLSVFSIADIVEVYSVSKGESHAFEMNAKAIEERIKGNSNEIYCPTHLNPDNNPIKNGTTIVLKQLKKNISTAATYLRRRVARRFSVIGKSNRFLVHINGEEITPRDRDYYRHIEFLWYFGAESKKYVGDCPNANRVTLVSDVLSVGENDRDTGYRISGWLGTVDGQEHIDEESNTIAIFAHGKLVHEDLLKDLKEGGIFTKYLIGEIDADFLDDDPNNDSITSARQSVKEDDPRFGILKENVKRHVKSVGLKWGPWRKELKANEVLQTRPSIRAWYETIKGKDRQKQAKELLGKIESGEYPDQETKKEIYKGTLVGFHRLSLTDQLSLLNKLETERDFELFSQLFGEIIEVERVDYYNITRSRLLVIEKLKEIVDSNKKEKVIQQHIFEALWLIDSSWDQAMSNTRMEERVTTEFKRVEDKLTDDELKARLDIRYQHISEKHVIIELKRFSANVDFQTLMIQVSKYRTALRKSLKAYFPNFHESMPIEVVCVTGRRPHSEESAETDEQMLRALNTRIITYDEILTTAFNTYRAYLQANERLSSLVTILNDIDKDFAIDESSDK
jgi:hypothetical protein